MSKLFYQDIQEIHCPEIYNLQKANVKDFGNNVWEKNEIISLLRKKKIFGKVCLQNEELCGFCFFYIFQDFLELYTIFVNPIYRKAGIAGRFINFAVKFCKKNDIKSIVLEVNQENETAIRLYINHKFKPYSRRKNYYFIHGRHFDAISMRLEVI